MSRKGLRFRRKFRKFYPLAGLLRSCFEIVSVPLMLLLLFLVHLKPALRAHCLVSKIRKTFSQQKHQTSSSFPKDVTDKAGESDVKQNESKKREDFNLFCDIISSSHHPLMIFHVSPLDGILLPPPSLDWFALDGMRGDLDWQKQSIKGKRARANPTEFN